LPLAGVLTIVATLFCISPAGADTDDASMAGINPTTVGLQPLKAPIAVATPYPGESKLRARADGTFEAIPDIKGRTKTYHLVARSAPWTLKSGLTIMAKTYNGVVPGPVIDVQRGDNVVIEYRNEMDISDTLHLHGIHGTPTSDDGVAGWGQPAVMPHGTYRYTFTATQPGTFMYHTHDREAVLNSGLYGPIIVRDPNEPAANRANRDYLVFISSWAIQSTSENHFTINGKEYPDSKQLEVASGDHVRIRYVNMSGENFHTMHIHGHEQHLIARDAWPVPGNPLQDTVEIGPGQRADVIVPAKAKPGTWMLQCHVMDHVEDDKGMPAGLITALHYKGTPQIFGAMSTAMTTMAMPPDAPQGQGKLSFGLTAFLGAFAGLTIFLGLPIARARKLSPKVIAALNAFAIGILVFLVVEIANNAIFPLKQSVLLWKNGGPFPWALSIAMAAGLVIGLVGLGAGATRLMKSGAGSDDPMRLSFLIAIGIGAHNFAEGLAIGASAAAGATAIALGLIVGFALHNATEGFGIAAPLAGRYVPSWRQLILAGIIGGGPTFIGTMIGYSFTSPLLSVLFLSTAVGALVFVIGELWSVLKKTGVTFATSSMVPAGFALGLITEMIVDLNGG
jgi:ZIP family zinc transporter